MSTKRPTWLDSHPREYWAPEDWAEARGWGITPAHELLYQETGRYPVRPAPRHELKGWMASEERRRADERHRRVDQILEAELGRR